MLDMPLQREAMPGEAPTVATQEILTRLSHDLRTPVGHIIGYAEMLIEDTLEAGQPVSPDLEKIQAAGRRLLHLIDERLTVSPRSLHSAFSVAPSRPVYSENRDGMMAGEEHPIATETGIILVVDNSEENRDVLARRLQRLGHHAVVASTGTEALACLEEQVFDLVLLDVLMPEISGYELLHRIKSDARTAHIPVIMISALDDLESVVRCIELGAEDYLSQPFEPTLLRARIRAALRAKRAHDREILLTNRLRENYERLKQAERLRDDLTGMIVHDLRTPLTSILSGLQTLDSLGNLDENQQEMLVISIDGAQTLLGMINDLLDISKMEDGSLRLEIGELNAPDLVERARRQVALLARQKGLELREEWESDLPAFRGDEDKLRRTLVNLLGNAIKFTPPGGAVTLGARQDGANDMVFYVRDTGEGIPKESFGRIFEKFGQVESRKAGRKMSTGLGLTFCKMAVEAHGGRIWVESEMGVGSTFFFSIPR